MESKSLFDFIPYVKQQPECDFPKWLQQSRKKYVAELKATGLPSQKQEHFGYLNLSQIYPKLNPQEISVPALANIPEKLSDDSIRLVFINNRFESTLSDELPDGVTVLSLKNAFLKHEDLLKTIWPSSLDSKRYPLAALALGISQEGFLFNVEKNKHFTKPFHFLHITTAANYNKPLFFYSFAKNSKVTLFEEFLCQAPEISLQYGHYTIHLDTHAKLDHTILNDHASAVWRTVNVVIKENADASFVSCVFGNEFFRQDMLCHLQKPFAHCKTSGVYRATKTNYIDHHLEILHQAPNTESDMLFKGTINDTAKAVFNGKLYVEKDAQKITAFQANHHLVLSNQAESYSKPELEIYADDVKCKHGATTAAFDDDSIFYLRSRGFSEVEAKKLMLDAFFESIISRIILPSEFISHIKSNMDENNHAI